MTVFLNKTLPWPDVTIFHHQIEIKTGAPLPFIQLTESSQIIILCLASYNACQLFTDAFYESRVAEIYINPDN